ncbi:MAG: thiamine pyrophosphate-dependent dehydrogenase E1 component subunit alpha [Sandaracinaceae bacterium]|nr:thiamine pyrophosphate-dependent dehydrogenase E1 component subunit alpha [Sandaracinaceae bacterium]
MRALLPRRRRELDRTHLPDDTVPPSAADAPLPSTSVVPLPTEASELRVAMLDRMLRIRAFEETLAAEWERGGLPTAAIHLGTGQEAVAVGVCFALRSDDVIATTHRGHGHMLAKGAPADRMMAEIFGKDAGLCRGKGGSMHVTDASVGALGANGIVGASPILATGAALAFAHRGEERVAVAFLGDGATNQGMFHEALNLAATWKLPVLFVVENNGYGEFTPQHRSTPIERLADRAAAYGMPGVTIDGNDVDLVHRTASELIARVRGGGPALLECVTYRLRGHMEGDAQAYRTNEEVSAWRERDPIARLRAALIEESVLDAPRADALTREAHAAIEQALAFALAAGEPASSALMTHVFAPAHSAREARASAPRAA